MPSQRIAATKKCRSKAGNILNAEKDTATLAIKAPALFWSSLPVEPFVWSSLKSRASNISSI